LGNTLKELGRLEEAETNYRKAIALKPDFAEGHNNLGATLQEQGRLDEAETNYRKAIALKPDKFANAYDQLGFILQKKGESEEAEMYYKKYQSLAPNKISLTKSRGEILFNQGDFEKALLLFDSYDNITSRAQILETLYALGRVDDIYERIDARAVLDDQNLRVAAFAAFLAEREKKDTSHRFCNNPIEFIHFTNISSHIKESEGFIASLIDELRYIKTRWEINTTKKGFQASVNVFAHPLEKMGILKSIIIDEIYTYYSKFKNKSCSYIKKWPSEINLKGWHVVLKQQGHQTGHNHPDGWLSGVIYLKVVPSLGKDEGAIEFTLDSPNYFDVSSSRKKYQPRLGDIVFFPSSLYHRTLPFSTDMDRICISFDLMPTSVKH
jgi:tetratricopeptide (TPR) repeat protein